MLNKKFLTELYIKKELSIRDIANNFPFTALEISKALHKYNIKIRYRQPSLRTKRKISMNLMGRFKGIKKSKSQRLKQSLTMKNKLKNPKNHPNYKDGRTLRKSRCKDCNKILSRMSTFKGSLRCRKCTDKYHIKIGKFKGKNNGMFGVHRYGEKNPNWKGGISKLPYPINFNKNLKIQIRKRDKFTCQLCNIIEQEYYRALDVHHIDYDKFNLKDDNLITLCSSCHMRTNYDRLKWKKYFKNFIERKNK